MKQEITGIIPARAGFTNPYRHTETCRRDHPRSRGVYIPESLVDPFPEGSSPLARGLRGFCCGAAG